MTSQQTSQEVPRLTQKEFDTLKEACFQFNKEHIDNQFEGMLDALPEVLERRQLQVTPKLTTWGLAKKYATPVLIGVASGAAGAYLYKKMSTPKKSLLPTEVEEKETTTRLRAVGART